MHVPHEIPSLDAKCALHRQADKGFDRNPLREMQRSIKADKSDPFDVLAYVAFALPTETHASRAERAKARNTLNDTMSELGNAVQVRQAFMGMQRYLYS